MTPEDYEQIRRLVYEQSGINLGDQKMQLVRARLGKRLRAGGFRSYGAYIEYVRTDASGHELCTLIDAIATNTTHLFREAQHFAFLGEALRTWSADAAWRRRHCEVRIWSTACSSGEEPYSIAMVAHDAVGEQARLPVRILATDISTRVLGQARQGVYEFTRVRTVPEAFRQRYLAGMPGAPPRFQVCADLRRLITFAHFNLMTPQFPFRKPFDVIFCRNVMIYFDRPTQQALVEKLARVLAPGGYLLIGHSESLNAIKHTLGYVRPTIYQKAN